MQIKRIEPHTFEVEFFSDDRAQFDLDEGIFVHVWDDNSLHVVTAQIPEPLRPIIEALILELADRIEGEGEAEA